MMNSIDNSQGTLAKLLAKENIRIQHGNYSTAFFDVKNRVLGLPNWKNKGKDVYDLLCGHEVGHALYTPADAFDTPNGCNKTLLNIVEDARIERKVQNTYPGLISCFRRAYGQLHAENFFGVNDRDPSTLNFPDRLNLKFKLGNLFNTTFSAEEQVIVDSINSAETWDDVVSATLKLQTFLKEQEEAEAEKEQPSTPEPEADEAIQDDAGDEQADQTESSDESSSEEESDESNETDGSGSDDSDEQSTETDSNDSANSDETAEQGEKSEASSESTPTQESTEKPAETDASSDKDGQISVNRHADPSSEFVSETMKNFEAKSQDLLDTSVQTLLTLDVFAPSVEELDEVIIPYAKLAEYRRQSSMFMPSYSSVHVREDYVKFLDHTKKVVNNFIKEFELRKAAYQYSRSTVSKTGSLNVNRLHAYKTSDDLFLSVTKLANAKNHAMVMFVDYSGSMQRVLPSVLNQVINLSLFCRRLGIPFKVYAFTSDNGFANADARTDFYMVPEDTDYNRILVSNLSLLELVSSDLNRTDFDDALYALFIRSTTGGHGRGESLGGTPLNEALIVAHKVVEDMKAKFNPDRMISIFLTDGNGHMVKAVESAVSFKNMNAAAHLARRNHYCQSTNFRFKLNGKTVVTDHSKMTTKLIRNLRETTKSEVIGFFVAGMSQSVIGTHVANALTAGTGMSASTAWQKWISTLQNEFKKSDVLAIDEGFGYNKYFVVPNCSSLQFDTDDELEISADMTRGKIAREFMKYSGSKKSNRVFVTKFAEALA